MTQFTPDLSPIGYDSEKGFGVFFVCNNHSPSYYSNRKPVEVYLS